MTCPSETEICKILTPQNEREECEFCMMEKPIRSKEHRKYKVLCQDENNQYFIKCLKCRRESNHYTLRREARAAWDRSLDIARGVTKCILTFG